MKYIAINPVSLMVSVRSTKPASGLILPARFRALSSDAPMTKVVRSCLRSSVREPNRWEGKKHVQYCLSSPDPWLVALATIMWQGIVQGLSYDVIKLSVNAALAKLRAGNLAPSSETVRRTASAGRVRFRWTSYASDGRKRRELYVELLRRRREMSQWEQSDVEGSFRLPPKKRHRAR